jgi:hypothetical protein
VPFHAPVEPVGTVANLRFGVVTPIEISGGYKDACDEKCRIDQRQLALPDSLAGLHVEEVVVKSFITGRIGGIVLNAF